MGGGMEKRKKETETKKGQERITPNKHSEFGV